MMSDTPLGLTNANPGVGKKYLNSVQTTVTKRWKQL